ncbi:MAG: Spy/CpxP family protein refolding chaperone [Pseudomonadota bacterium]
MKHISIKQLLAISTLAIALPFSALSHADTGKHCNKHDSNHGHSYKHSTNWGGKTGIPHHLHALKLTQDQQDKIFAIVHEQAPAKYAQRKQQREAMKQLRTLSQADQFDEPKAQQLTDQLAKLEKDKTMSRLVTQAKINALLTPEQRQKARELKMSGYLRGHGMKESVRFKDKKAVEAKPVNS